jgi:hypothetical protein
MTDKETITILKKALEQIKKDKEIVYGTKFAQMDIAWCIANHALKEVNNENN